MKTLKELRWSQALKQCDLALLTGIRQPTLSEIERGYLLPTASQKLKLAAALGVQPDSLKFHKRVYAK
jgi:transcriptional regulator with XRE-family HTH domain